MLCYSPPEPGSEQALILPTYFWGFSWQINCCTWRYPESNRAHLPWRTQTSGLSGCLTWFHFVTSVGCHWFPGGREFPAKQWPDRNPSALDQCNVFCSIRKMFSQRYEPRTGVWGGGVERAVLVDTKPADIHRSTVCGGTCGDVIRSPCSSAWWCIWSSSCPHTVSQIVTKAQLSVFQPLL